MDTTEIEKRLRLGEDSVTEFKSVAKTEGKADAGDLAKEIVALANTRGGHLLLGVEDDGTPTGIGSIEQADGLMRQVSQVCLNRIRPAISVTLHKEQFQGFLLLIVEVPEFSPDRPYMTDENCYVRDGSLSRKASRNELIRIAQSSHVHFEEETVRGAKFDDLDPLAIQTLLASRYQKTFAEAEEVKRYLMALKCLNPEDVPTVAGILLLGSAPDKWLPDAYISAVRIHGTSYTTSWADRVECYGRVIEQVEGTMAFLDRHLLSPAKVEGLVRVERLAPGTVPKEVLREALFNAVVHRDYRTSSQTRLFIFDDRIDIVNPGELLNQLTIEGIRAGGISQRRNPVIASILTRLDRRENLGGGIPEMMRLMTGRGLPEPEFDVKDGHFRIILRGERRV